MSARVPLLLALVAFGAACDDLPFTSDEPDRDVVQLSASETRTCARTRDGAVYCWGDNAGGGLGDGTTAARLEPVRVRLDGDASLVIDASCALVDRVLHCWGRRFAEEGDSSVRAQPRFTEHRWRTVSVTANDGCGIDLDRRAWCWGTNYSGNLGDGTRNDSPQPVEVAGDMRWLSITTNGSISCGITTDERGWCWGSNDSGQLGIGERPPYGTADYRTTPHQLASDHRWRAIRTGTWSSACGLTDTGEALCWGYAIEPPGDPFPDQSAPYPVGLEGDEIAVGQAHLCVLSAGRAFCYGRNSSGELGAGSFDQPLSPVPVAGAAEYVDIAAGRAHTCAATRGGAVDCWGFNGQLQLGDGTADDRPAPVRVPLPH